MIFFKLIKEATLKISAKSEQLLAFVVKGLRCSVLCMALQSRELKRTKNQALKPVHCPVVEDTGYPVEQLLMGVRHLETSSRRTPRQHTKMQAFVHFLFKNQKLQTQQSQNQLIVLYFCCFIQLNQQLPISLS